MKPWRWGAWNDTYTTLLADSNILIYAFMYHVQKWSIFDVIINLGRSERYKVSWLAEPDARHGHIDAGAAYQNRLNCNL